MCDVKRKGRYQHSEKLAVIWNTGRKLLDVCERCWADHCDDNKEFALPRSKGDTQLRPYVRKT